VYLKLVEGVDDLAGGMLDTVEYDVLFVGEVRNNDDVQRQQFHELCTIMFFDFSIACAGFYLPERMLDAQKDFGDLVQANHETCKE
jgi:hypothetical protein